MCIWYTTFTYITGQRWLVGWFIGWRIFDLVFGHYGIIYVNMCDLIAVATVMLLMYQPRHMDL
jgi:hypothetical protein